MRWLLGNIVSFIYSIDDYIGEYIAIFILLAWNAFIVYVVFHYS